MRFGKHAAIGGFVLTFASTVLGQEGEPPRMPVFDAQAVDPDVDPCDDFYAFACARWLRDNPMPPDVTFWSRPFTSYRRAVDGYMDQVVRDLARSDDPRSRDEQLIGDHYCACMDESLIEKRGLDPLFQELALIDGLASHGDLATVLGALHRQLPYSGVVAEPLFYIYASNDPVEGARAARLHIGPAGLGLPIPDMYADAADEAAVIRETYVEHIAATLAQLGTGFGGEERARAILHFETQLAAALLPLAQISNDPSLTANPMSLAALDALMPGFAWPDYLRAHGIPIDDRVNVQQPQFMGRLDELLGATPIEDLRSYLRWQLLSERASLLPLSLRAGRFEFFDRRLRGQAELSERSAACLAAVTRDLPEALSRVFVQRVRRPGVRERVRAMYEKIKAVMHDRIEGADWMEPETRAFARAKLDAVRLVIGWPEAWLDDPHLVIRRDDFYGNTVRAGTARRRASLQGLGEPMGLDWIWYPLTDVGGHYDPGQNAIIINMGMLLLLDGGGDDLAVAYGGLGHFLAHELLHGFDPSGRKYDAEGRLHDWWTAADAQRFDERARCVVEQFTGLEYAPGVTIDGKHVVSEQVAELGAWSIAWEAHGRATADHPEPARGGYTSLQRYLITCAQIWCSTATVGRWREFAATSSKAWAAPAVHGTILNLPEFADAFGCAPEHAMTQPASNMCRVW